MTTVTVDTHRELALGHLEAGQVYEFLTIAAPYLDVYRDDHHMRLMAVREYLKLGLVVPARELLEVGATGGTLPPELASIRESLSRVLGEAVSWSTCTRRYETNLAALAGRGVDTTTIREAWTKRREDYQLFRDNRGIEQVRARERAGPHAVGAWRWVPRLGDHRAIDEAGPLPEGVGSPMPGPYLFEGLDLGFYFQRVYQRTLDTFLGYSCALFVVEPDPSAIAMVLHLRDWVQLLSDPRVLWFVGDDCHEGLRQAWSEDGNLPFPCQAFSSRMLTESGAASAVEVIRDAGSQREGEIGRSLVDLNERYALRDPRYWAQRFEGALLGRDEPLRILAAVSTHTTFLKYSMRDAKRAFESLGHRCVVLTEESPYHITGPLTYHKAIRELDPDLFFVIDHLRSEFADLLPKGLPLLTWDQDQLPHVFTEANMRAIGPLDFVVGYSAPKCAEAGCDPKQVLSAGVPTCGEQFSGPPLTDLERKRYSCDVSYVSHASQTPRAFHEEERRGYTDPKIHRLLEAMFELTPSSIATSGVMTGTVAVRVIKEASRLTGIEVTSAELRSRFIEWYLWRLGDRLFRHQALEWVAQWARQSKRTFRIYGRGWDEHPTLKEFAAGPAANGRELLCVYRASKINLQLMPAGFVHQRALDGLVGGGFFLSRRTPHDHSGRTLRRLDNRIGELDIRSTRELLETNDAALQSLLHEYMGETLREVDPNSQQLYLRLRGEAELVHPDEVFPDFDEILFGSAREFQEKTDRFIADDASRERIAETMRRIVVEHYSYRPTMERFLQKMGAWFRESGS